MSQAFTIRPERPSEAAAIHALLIAAFDGPQEASLVAALRADGDLALSLVAAHGDAIIAHIAFSPIAVSGARAMALAPLAVAEDWRGRGVARALVGAAHRMLEERAETLAFVLGDPAFYTRFGYTLEAAKPYESLWSGAHFMARRLGPGTPPAPGRLRYARAFDTLS